MDTTDREHLQRMLTRYGVLDFGKVFAQLAIEAAHHQEARDGVREPRCSFCGKRKSEVADHMIAGAGVFNCIRCIDICHNVRLQWPDQK